MNGLIAALRRYHRFRGVRKALAGKESSSAEPELRLLHSLLEPGKAFVDVGANIGEYVYAASRYVPLSKIYAFEPQQAYVDDLRAFFPGLAVERIALSSVGGEARLKIPVIRDNLYRTRGTLESFREEGEERAQYETVPTDTLDEMARKLHMGAIGCIKIDVEGHERFVLEGAIKTLAREHPALIIEVEQRHHPEPITEIFRSLAGMGYQGRFFDTASGSLAPIEKFSVSSHQRPEMFKTPSYVRNFIFTYHG